jgi:hypothetical protein
MRRLKKEQDAIRVYYSKCSSVYEYDKKFPKKPSSLRPERRVIRYKECLGISSQN